MWATNLLLFPIQTVLVGIADGSRILTYFPHVLRRGIDPPQMAKIFRFGIPSLYGTDSKQQQSDMLHLYGVGDHGGGPREPCWITPRAGMKSDVVYPNVRFSTARSFIRRPGEKTAHDEGADVAR